MMIYKTNINCSFQEIVWFIVPLFTLHIVFGPKKFLFSPHIGMRVSEVIFGLGQYDAKRGTINRTIAIHSSPHFYYITLQIISAENKISRRFHVIS